MGCQHTAAVTVTGVEKLLGDPRGIWWIDLGVNATGSRLPVPPGCAAGCRDRRQALGVVR